MPGLLAWEPTHHLAGDSSACRDGLARRNPFLRFRHRILESFWGLSCNDEPDCLDLPKCVKASYIDGDPGDCNPWALNPTMMLATLFR
jgi:hypothetical protein